MTKKSGSATVMAVLLLSFLLSSIFTYSNAEVCVCKDGNEQEFKKVIDFACESGADCTLIQQNGTCFQPNTVKNHCDVAVNSYYQKKASTGSTCDFNGAAFIPTSPPSPTSRCLSSSSSNGIPTTGDSTTGSPMPAPSSSGFPGIYWGPAESTGFSVGEKLSVGTMKVILLTTITTVALWV